MRQYPNWDACGEKANRMEEWKKLEFEYARQLREAACEERRSLYSEAYSRVSELMIQTLPKEVERRTAGTSPGLVRYLTKRCNVNDSILEVGCGRGYTCLKLSKYVSSIIGTDISSPALSEAADLMQKQSVGNVRFHKLNAFDIDTVFTKESLDKIISIDVLEHLHPSDAIRSLRAAHTLLKPGGQLIIVTPNRLDGPHDITKTEYPEAKAAKGFHLNETTWSELLPILKQIGFRKCRSFLSHNFMGFPISGLQYPSLVNRITERVYDLIAGIPIARRLLAGVLSNQAHWV